MTESCPECHREPAAIVEVATVGTDDYDVQGGYVCLDRADDNSSWRLFVHRTSPGIATGYQWDASHYDDVAFRVDCGGGCVSWYRKLKTSGSARWHKVVTHHDGSVRAHWLTDREHVFTDVFRSVALRAVPVPDSPFRDQKLYDELQERGDREQLLIEQHLERIREEADST